MLNINNNINKNHEIPTESANETEAKPNPWEKKYSHFPVEPFDAYPKLLLATETH